MAKIWMVSAFWILGACASLGGGDDKIELDESSKLKRDVIKAQSVGGLADYAGGKVEWMGCKTPGAKKSFLVVTRDTPEFKSDRFCENWISQAFISSGYDVVGVNRPGIGSTTPKASDFAGKKSVAAIEAAANHAVNKQKFQPIVGIWAYDSGTIAASFAAKKLKSVTWLIFGAGIYDAESFYNGSDGAIKKEFEAVVGKDDGGEVFEARSISWDPAGLPKNIFLYAGKKDTLIPWQQTQVFSDALATQEYTIKTQFLDESDHEIAESTHRALIEGVLKNVQ
jgi:hypothetical protein